MTLLTVNNHLDGVEEKIDAFIYSVTGLHVKEETVGDKFTLRLGVKDPIELGFYKSRHPEVTDFRFSAYLRMIAEFSRFMTSGSEFEVWCHLQKL